MITNAPYSSGTDSRSTYARRITPPNSASPNDKTAYIMFRASFFDLRYVTIGRQTLQQPVCQFFSPWVSIRHPRLDGEGVYCTPLTLNLLQELLIPGYSSRCFFGRGSEGASEKTENRSRQHCRKRFRSSKPLVNTHPFAPCCPVRRSSVMGSVLAHPLRQRPHRRCVGKLSKQ